MDVHMVKSRTFRKTVLYYTIILMIPIFIFFYISIQNIIDENHANLLDMHDADTQRVAAAIDSKLMDFMHIGDSLYHSKWINKLMVDLDSFDEEFNIITRQEINQELRNYIAFTGLLSNISVVFPYKDLVISQNGWYSIDNYFSDVMKISRDDVEKINSHIKEYAYFQVIGDVETIDKSSASDNIVISQSLEINSRPRAVLLFFVNREYLKAYTKKITFPNLHNFLIRSEDFDILRDSSGGDITKTNEDLLTFNVFSEVTNWEYICTYNNTKLPINTEQLFPLYIGITLSLLTGFAAAIVLAILSYKPLYNLFNKIFNHDEIDSEPPKEAFYEYNAIETSYSNLVDKNEEMARRMKDYENAAKNNLLLRLLKGYFDNEKLDEKLEEIGVPYDNDYYFCVMLINISYVENDKPVDVFIRKQSVINSLIIVEQVIDDYDLDYKIVDVLDDTFALIFSFNEIEKNTDFLEKLSSEIKGHIQEYCDIDVIMSRGNIEKGIIGISKSYQMARENIEYIIFGMDKSSSPIDILNSQLYYYPTDWEIQLINNLKIGDFDTVKRIIDEMKLENERRDLPENSMIRLVTVIMETQLRVLDELNIDTKLYQDDFEKIIVSDDIGKMWKYIYEISDRICYRSQYANSVTNFELANNIIDYIDANYNDPDLSLKELAGVFDMSLSSLSKLLKEVTGVKYYDYLSRIRMEKAKELLKDTDKNINVIANEVGYENEHSFRRAFKRYEGITPSDYVQVGSKQ